MSTVKAIAITRAVALLQAAGVDFVIRREDGATLGTLKIATDEPEKKRRVSKYAHGMLKEIVMPVIENMQPGDAAVVPYKGVDTHSMQSAVCARADKLWGAKSYITHKNAVGVEILRVS